MKKFFLIFVLVFITNSMNAQISEQKQIIRKVATTYTINVDSQWLELRECYVPIEINLTDRRVIIYSKQKQIYDVLEEYPVPSDSEHTQIGFMVIDHNNDRGLIRFVALPNGILQIYIDFENIGWCYNIEE